ncbi:M57 family metalloprotease [Roseivirga sp. BDSF3-8]|uniref:M57 family metalloprotease n=1 Tax=Roseivirga sp. BDSF3-8 TaxID=3241598 RepID=UPI00353189DA
MKRLTPGSRFAALIATAMLIFSSCQDNTVLEEMDPATEAVLETEHPVVQKLLEFGFKAEDILSIEGYFLVEGDMLFSKDIQEWPFEAGAQKGVNEEQYRTSNLVTTANQVIRVNLYNVKTTDNDNWYNAALLAMQDWTNVTNCRIQFQEDGGYEDITVRFDNGSLPANVIAAAGFPSAGKPYLEVLINPDFYSNMNVSESTKRYNMVHELGHCIGFRHSNYASRGESAGTVGAVQVPGTPASDGGSVMNGGTALYSWAGFSSYDQIAVRNLYPEPSCPSQAVSSYYNDWLTYPNGGQELIENDTYTIRWNTARFTGSQVKLELLSYGDLYMNNWNGTSLSTTVPNTGSYSWAVGPIKHDNRSSFQIRISDPGNCSRWDVSDSYFRLERD